MANLKFDLFGCTVKMALIALTNDKHSFFDYSIELYDINSSIENLVGQDSFMNPTQAFCLEASEKLLVSAYRNYGIEFVSADWNILRAKIDKLFSIY